LGKPLEQNLLRIDLTDDTWNCFGSLVVEDYECIMVSHAWPDRAADERKEESLHHLQNEGVDQKVGAYWYKI